MKNKFPIILLVLFTIFAIIKIAFTNSMIYMEKKDYTTFEQTIGELKYSLDNSEMDNLKEKYMDILFQINSLNVKQAGDSGESDPEVKNIYGNDKLKAKLLAIFLLLGVLTYAEDNDTTVIINDNAQKAIDNGEVITTEVTKKVVGENNQQLDVKEIDTEELILQNQNLESSSINITGENLKENGDKVKVNRENTATIEEELSQGVEKKGFFRRIIDKLFG